MTKFEEDLNKKMDLKEVPMYFTQSGCSMTRKTYIETNWIFDNYKNWHSDEEFQELLDKYSNLNDNYEKEVIRSSKLESQLISREKQVIELREADKAQGKEIIQLKSQLQQQALPVVPECVAVQIERVKNSNGNFATLGLFDSNYDKKPDYAKWIEDNINEFMVACSVGYIVEKLQLFYLKNKIELEDVGSDLIGYLNLFLTNGGYLTNNINRAKKFTQAEIESMETGSYEQIEVAE